MAKIKSGHKKSKVKRTAQKSELVQKPVPLANPSAMPQALMSQQIPQPTQGMQIAQGAFNKMKGRKSKNKANG